MYTPSNQTTQKLVFSLFHGTNLLLVAASVLTSLFLRSESPFENVMAQLFLYGALFTLLGAKAGGYLGAVMEEDACSTLDMGVLSAMGSFVGATVFGLFGTAIVGLYFFLPSHWISAGLGIAFVSLFTFCSKKTATIVRATAIDCCGNRVDSNGTLLPVQPVKMKYKLAVVLAATLVVEALLTVLMFTVMKRDFANNQMLGAMMYAMGGSMLGGMLGGWLAGLLDEHTGEPEHDNPIMVCAMALMAGMMGGMPAAMAGGMMALMGAATILPTLVGALVIFAVCYFWMFRPEFKFRWMDRHPSEGVGRLEWQKP